MIEIRLGTRYAKSILSLAEEKGQVEDVYQDFKLIDEVCNANKDFRNMLRSPLIHSDKKQSIIQKVFGEKYKSTITREFIAIIIRKKREPYLQDIADRVKHLYDVRKNITRGTLTSAASLSQDQLDRIKKIVEEEMGTNFKLVEKVDPELIGGFTLLVGDREFDGSVASRIRDLRREFDDNPYVKK